jgi:hypothetical protein
MSDTVGSSFCIYLQFSDYDPYLIGITCLFMAGKLEEDKIHVRDAINVSHNTLHPDAEVLALDDEYWLHKDTLFNCELLVHRMLKFDVLVDLPHKVSHAQNADANVAQK